jgi:hypothetical protein
MADKASWVDANQAEDGSYQLSRGWKERLHCGSKAHYRVTVELDEGQAKGCPLTQEGFDRGICVPEWEVHGAQNDASMIQRTRIAKCVRSVEVPMAEAGRSVVGHMNSFAECCLYSWKCTRMRDMRQMIQVVLSQNTWHQRTWTPLNIGNGGQGGLERSTVIECDPAEETCAIRLVVNAVDI